MIKSLKSQSEANSVGEKACYFGKGKKVSVKTGKF